jgi:hypothetical protein
MKEAMLKKIGMEKKIDGGLMKTDDDKKQGGLTMETIKTIIDLSGGYLSWTILFFSVFMTKVSQLYMQH